MLEELHLEFSYVKQRCEQRRGFQFVTLSALVNNL